MTIELQFNDSQVKEMFDFLSWTDDLTMKTT